MKKRNPKQLRAAMELRKKFLTNKRIDLMNLVHENLYTLKNNSTIEERSRLDAVRLDPNSSSRCVLGQMTGYSWSVRAREILPRENNKLSCFEVYLQKCGKKTHEDIVTFLQNDSVSIKLPFIDLCPNSNQFILH